MRAVVAWYALHTPQRPAREQGDDRAHYPERCMIYRRSKPQFIRLSMQARPPGSSARGSPLGRRWHGIDGAGEAGRRPEQPHEASAPVPSEQRRGVPPQVTYAFGFSLSADFRRFPLSPSRPFLTPLSPRGRATAAHRECALRRTTGLREREREKSRFSKSLRCLGSGLARWAGSSASPSAP